MALKAANNVRREPWQHVVMVCTVVIKVGHINCIPVVPAAVRDGIVHDQATRGAEAARSPLGAPPNLFEGLQVAPAVVVPIGISTRAAIVVGLIENSAVGAPHKRPRPTPALAISQYVDHAVCPRLVGVGPERDRGAVSEESVQEGVHAGSLVHVQKAVAVDEGAVDVEDDGERWRRLQWCRCCCW